MKLLCIDASPIISIDSDSSRRTHQGHGLKEGEIYETKGELFTNYFGDSVYYIQGLGIRLACRFTKALSPEKIEIKLTEFIEAHLN